MPEKTSLYVKHKNINLLAIKYIRTGINVGILRGKVILNLFIENTFNYLFV